MTMSGAPGLADSFVYVALEPNDLIRIHAMFESIDSRMSGAIPSLITQL
jgi:hypothetical protein